MASANHDTPMTVDTSNGTSVYEEEVPAWDAFGEVLKKSGLSTRPGACWHATCLGQKVTPETLSTSCHQGVDDQRESDRLGNCILVMKPSALRQTEENGAYFGRFTPGYCMYIGPTSVEAWNFGQYLDSPSGRQEWLLRFTKNMSSQSSQEHTISCRESCNKVGKTCTSQAVICPTRCWSSSFFQPAPYPSFTALLSILEELQKVVSLHPVRQKTATFIRQVQALSA